MFCVCVYVSRTVFFFRCPVKIHPLPLTVDIRPLSQPSFHLVSFKIAIGNATFIYSSTSAFASSSSVSASTSQLRPVPFSSPSFFSTGLTVLIRVVNSFALFECRGSSLPSLVSSWSFRPHSSSYSPATLCFGSLFRFGSLGA